MYHHIVFNKDLIPADKIPDGCNLFDRISFEILVSNGDHVSVGDALVRFRFFKDSLTRQIIDSLNNTPPAEYVLLSAFDGFVCGIWGQAGKAFRVINAINHGILLMSISTVGEETVQYNHPTCYRIERDEFTSEQVIHWVRVAGLHTTGYTLSSSFALEFTIGGGVPTTALRFSKKTCNIRRKDAVAFKFEDGEVIRYLITKQPVMCDKALGTYSVNFPLTGKDIQIFTTKGWDSFRVEHENGEPPFVVPNMYRDHYNIPESLDIFKRYAKEYAKALDEIGIDLSEPVKDEPQPVQSIEEPCFVYLMVDTTNGYHKIGISNHPEYRERTLQSEKPSIEKIAAKQFPTRDIARAFEASLHKVYEIRRLRGEWFKLEPNEVEDVKKALE